MTAEGEEFWRRDLALLRERLERLEEEARRQHEAIGQVRESILQLEGRIPAVPEVVAAVFSLPPMETVPAPSEVTAVAEPFIPVPPPLPGRPPAEKEGPFELQFGRVWLVRLGIVLLLTGLVLLGNFAYQNWIRELSAGLRLLGLFACSGLLIEGGRRLAARASLQRFGEVILAGGLSFFYYCTFAAHQVPRLKVIDSPVLAAVLLLLAAGLIAAVSWFRNARATAVLGLLLASYSTMLQPIGWLSCVSSLLLAAAGLVFMLRPGWAGPGVASMVGTYAAFLGWQWLGAARGDLRDPAVMGFLPPVWILFSLPGVLGQFREAMSDRARAWFTGGNNAAFFLLFSGLWIDRFETQDYWMVCAVFGTVLILLGALGRRANQIAGGVNLVQGFSLASLAIILKLEGYHLALGLAIEALSLAIAFVRFRGKSELVFSCLAGTGAVLMTCVAVLPKGVRGDFPVPVWSAGLVALAIAAASAALRHGTDRCDEKLHGGARLASGGMFFVAVLAALVGWCLRLPPPWPLPVMIGIATALAAISLRLDRPRKMPEVILGSLIFLIAGAIDGVWAKGSEAIGAAAAFALAGAWLWHHIPAAEEPDPLDLKNHPAIGGWSFAVVTVGLAWLGFQRSALELHILVPALGITGLLLGGLGVLARIDRLAPCAALLNAAALVQLLASSGHSVYAPLGVAAIALATLPVLAAPARLSKPLRLATIVVVRLTGFTALCAFWRDFSPMDANDGLALMAIVLTMIAWARKQRPVAEVIGFLTVAVCGLAWQGLTTSWSEIADPSWRGGGVVIGLLLLAGSRRLQRPNHDGLWSRVPVNGTAWLVASLWATKMLVWREDWHAVSVLWTVLGFVFVSAGLGMRIRIFRLGGFCLLALAVIKVFAVDVWDFNAFMRVVSFIVLGAALILLGLFYNRFAPMLKRLLEEGETEN